MPDLTSPATRTRRRPSVRWVLPLLVVLVWLVVGGAAGGAAAPRLAEVQENDNSAFLPEDAESAEVQRLQARFRGGDTFAAVVVWEADDGAVPPELGARAAADLERASRLPDVAGEVVGPVPSADGQALQGVVPLRGDIGGEELTSAVAGLRALLADPPGGAAYVTGPAGFFGDFGEAFGAIDGLLLVVAGVVVLLILVVVYRSPLLPLLVLLSAALALGAASAVVYLLAAADLLTLNGQSQGILFILVVGAATDYSLLLVARYREELRRAEAGSAMGVALRRSLEPVLASGGTVVLGVLCLLASELSNNRSLGPVAAVGVVFAVAVALSFLPAALVLLGRAAFWPFRPRLGSAEKTGPGLWGRVAGLVERRSRLVLVVVLVVLALGSAFAPRLDTGGVSQSEFFLDRPESVVGQEVLAAHYAAGAGRPLTVVGDAERLPALVEAAQGLDGVARAVPVPAGPPGSGAAPQVVDGLVQVEATLSAADGEQSDRAVRELREAVRDVDDDALVGGAAAVDLDVREASARDLRTIVPLVLLVILVVLALLLRALVAPVLLVATVVLSFGATLGVAALVFEHVLDFAGGDPTIPLYAFVFLGALGIDYNIFLMTRAREEAQRLGTRPGTTRALALTGGVITSAGVVLAATFAALAVLPVLFLVQIAFLVAFGVLLDTFVVRGLLVPAIVHQLGPRIWWPSRLAREDGTGPSGAWHRRRTERRERIADRLGLPA